MSCPGMASCEGKLKINRDEAEWDKLWREEGVEDREEWLHRVKAEGDLLKERADANLLVINQFAFHDGKYWWKGEDLEEMKEEAERCGAVREIVERWDGPTQTYRYSFITMMGQLKEVLGDVLPKLTRYVDYVFSRTEYTQIRDRDWLRDRVWMRIEQLLEETEDWDMVIIRARAEKRDE